MKPPVSFGGWGQFERFENLNVAALNKVIVSRVRKLIGNMLAAQCVCVCVCVGVLSLGRICNLKLEPHSCTRACATSQTVVTFISANLLPSTSAHMSNKEEDAGHGCSNQAWPNPQPHTCSGPGGKKLFNKGLISLKTKKTKTQQGEANVSALVLVWNVDAMMVGRKTWLIMEGCAEKRLLSICVRRKSRVRKRRWISTFSSIVSQQRGGGGHTSLFIGLCWKTSERRKWGM